MRKATQGLWLVLVVLGLSSVGMAVHAEESRPSQPSDHFNALFWAGELGAVIGGLSIVYSPSDLQDYLIRLLLGRYINPYQGCLKMEPFFCPGARLRFIFLLNLGRALGASTGVVLAGMQLGVEGNIWGAYWATGLWFIAASPYLPYRNDLWMLPFAPAFMATIGYRLGAKMKAGQPAAWQLPLIVWRF